MNAKKILSPDELRELDIAKSIGGLNKSHKAQRLANSIEAVYFNNALICFKSDRAESQRNERRSKR